LYAILEIGVFSRECDPFWSVEFVLDKFSSNKVVLLLAVAVQNFEGAFPEFIGVSERFRLGEVVRTLSQEAFPFIVLLTVFEALSVGRQASTMFTSSAVVIMGELATVAELAVSLLKVEAWFGVGLFWSISSTTRTTASSSTSPHSGWWRIRNVGRGRNSLTVYALCSSVLFRLP
jgi:hypothetical protein